MNRSYEILEFIKTHKDEIKDHFDVKQIGLFGSHVKGEATEESDLDFYVIFFNKSYRNLVGLYSYLEKHFDAKVDIVTEHTQMRKAFRREILETVQYE
jgi:uncharacterized protein